MHRLLGKPWRRWTGIFGARRNGPKPRNYARLLTLEQFECRSLLVTATLSAVADNTMFEESGDLSNGIGIYIFAGRTSGLNNPNTNTPALSRRALVRFNVGSIPAGSQVTSATLRLQESRVPAAAPAAAIALHRATATWGEGTSDAICIGSNEGCGAQATAGDATWTTRVYPNTMWSSPFGGGDFVGGASATTTVGGLGSYQWTSPQLAADVQGWVNAPASNFGWVIKAVDESVLRSAKRFNSLQNGANPPQLVVEYTAGANIPPTLNTIPNPPAILEDSGLQTVNLSGITAGVGETQELTVTAVSSNPALIPNPTVNYANPSAVGSLSYTPEPDQAGTAVITVTVQDDGGGATDTIVRTFTVTVTQVNDAPEIDPIANPAPVPEDGGLRTITLTGILDGPNENQTLTIAATSNNTPLIPNPTIAYTNPNATATLSFTPAANQSGTATITVTVTDNGGTLNGGVNVTTRTFTITVTPVNDQPTLNVIANPAAILEDTAAAQIISLAGIAAGAGETQTLTVTASSNNLALIPNPTVTYTSPNTTGTLSYTPAANQFGSATITVTVRDSGGTPGVDFITRTFIVSVTGVNDAPTLAAIPDPPAIARNAAAQTVNLSGIGAGPNESSQTLTVTATSSNSGLIPNPTVTYTSPAATGSLSYTPVANQIGTAVITVTVTDNGGTANGGVNVFERTFTVNVTTINAAPTLDTIANPAAILEDAAAQTVNLTGISAGTGETQTLTVTAVSSNPGLIPNPTITYASPSATGTLSYTPVAHQSGTAIITVTVTDSGGTAGGGVDAATRTFTVNVTPVNDAPTLDAIPNPPFIQQNAGLQTVNLAGISAGPSETQVITITATSSNLGLIPNPTVAYVSPAATGSLSYTPVADQGGTALITVTVTDDGGTTNGGVNFVTRTFTVTVFISTAANDPPSFAKGPDQAVIDGSGPKTVPGWATAISPGPPDEASQAVDFIVTNNSNALFLAQPAINPAGTLTFTPQPNVSGLVQVTVVLHDDGGTLGGGVDTSPPQTFTINISKPDLWHNNAPLPLPKIGALDVDYDTFISPIDAVLIINYLNLLTGSGDDQVPPNALVGKTGNLNPGMAEFLDTGGGGPLGDQPDNFVSPIDAVLVINWLNNNPVTASPGGEGEGLALPTAGSSYSLASVSPAEDAVTPARRADHSDLAELISLLALDAADAARPRRRR